jgi:hypothetical protein
MSDVVLGLRVGQKRDPSAVCIAQRETRRVECRDEVHFLVRHLERIGVGTSFPSIAARMAELVGAAWQRSVVRHLYVDTTGMGHPLVEVLESRTPGLRIIATYFTYGDQRTEENYRTVRLGKAYLVTRLLMLLQSGRLHLPRTAEAETLRIELREYQPRTYDNANEREGAFKVGSHDDLVTALGLAVQLDNGGDVTDGTLPW